MTTQQIIRRIKQSQERISKERGNLRKLIEDATDVCEFSMRDVAKMIENLARVQEDERIRLEQEIIYVREEV